MGYAPVHEQENRVVERRRRPRAEGREEKERTDVARPAYSIRQACGALPLGESKGAKMNPAKQPSFGKATNHVAYAALYVGQRVRVRTISREFEAIVAEETRREGSPVVRLIGGPVGCPEFVARKSVEPI